MPKREESYCTRVALWDRKRQIYSKRPQNALLTQFIFQKLAEGVIIIRYGSGRGFQAPFFRHRKVLRHIFYFVYKIEIFCIGMADKQKITEETMDIIIIGCGKVGTTLAEQLVREDHNVVMIDTSAERMQRVSDDIDAIKLVGMVPAFPCRSRQVCRRRTC